MRRHIGKFNQRLELMKPSAPMRDEMGGYKPKVYTPEGIVFAMQRDKTSTYRQVIGDYVTVNTCYFVCRDFRSKHDINTEWRIKHKGYDYIINSIVLLDDTTPYFLEIEATRIGGIG